MNRLCEFVIVVFGALNLCKTKMTKSDFALTKGYPANKLLHKLATAVNLPLSTLS